MIRILNCIALATGAWLAMPAPAQAAESYDNCTGFIDSLPATITTQGTWCLNKDVTTSMTSGDAITIDTSNVTLDCNHFKVGGLGGGAATTARGVYATSRFNVTVRNCNIRGFYFGLYFDFGGGQLVEDNTFDGSTYTGILLYASPGSTIRNNLVIDTGGSIAYAASAYGIYVTSGVDVLGNTINGVAPGGNHASAYGVFAATSPSGIGSIVGNRIRGLAPTFGGAPYGIYSFHPYPDVIRDNDVQGPGPGVAGGIGINCDSNATTARGNVIAGFETGIVNCLDSANVVNPN